MQLSEKSRAILEAIARGHTYEQILVQDLAWTYHDIFAAAAEALKLENSLPESDYEQRMTEIKQDHPRAYEKWSPEEDEQLRQLFYSNTSPSKMSEILKRQPSAIRSRLVKLNLTK
jgi:hypothetical protein